MTRAEPQPWVETAYSAALLELGDRLLNVEDASEMGYVASEIIGHTLGVIRVGYGTMDAAGGVVEVAREWHAPGYRSLAGRRRFMDSDAYERRLMHGEPIIYGDTEHEAPLPAATAWLAIGARSVVNMPVFERGRLVAVIYLHGATPRTWTPGEIAFLRDVAERTRSAVERRRAENNLRALNETLELQVAERTADRNRLWRLSSDVMLIARFDGVMVAANPAWTTTLGWHERELVGNNIADLVHPDDLPDTARKMQSLRRGDALRGLEARLRHRDGSYRWLSWNAVPGGGMINAVGRDFTAEHEKSEALRQAEEQLRQAQKMEAIGQLTGGLAHDFNNLLSGILGSLDLIQTRIAQQRYHDLDRHIAAALEAANRAAAVTHRLLAVARRQALAPRPVDVNTLVGDMLDLIRSTVGVAITVETALAPEPWQTMCDPNQLENALLNLCINARDAMPDGGTLAIGTANACVDAREAQARSMAAGDYVVLSVTDTGIGMDAETAARAFDPFFTTKPQGQGTGLGLSMIYGFAKQSGGEVELRSAPGEGTSVCVMLPRLNPADLTEP